MSKEERLVGLRSDNVQMTLTLEVSFKIGREWERFVAGNGCPAVISRDFGQMFLSFVMILEFGIVDEAVVTEVAVISFVNDG